MRRSRISIVGGLDIHRKQITFDYLDTGTGQVQRGQISPADREHLRAWLARFAGREVVAFAAGGCTGWRYVAEELAAAGIAAHLAEPADTAFARGRKRHAKTDKTDCRHLRQLLAEGRLPECWIPPSHILECRALLETYHDLRAEHTAWVQRSWRAAGWRHPARRQTRSFHSGIRFPSGQPLWQNGMPQSMYRPACRSSRLGENGSYTSRQSAA